MDLGTQGAEQRQALQIAVCWINMKVAGTQGGVEKLLIQSPCRRDSLLENTVMVLPLKGIQVISRKLNF